MTAADGSESWVRRAERLLDRKAAPGDDEARLLGQRPVLLDTETTKAAVAPVLAAITWSAAVFREMVSPTSLDPIGMVLRAVALGLTLRVLLLGGLLVRRLRVWMEAPRWGLALTPDGLLLRTPTHDVAIPREDVIAVVERDKWQERRAGRRWTEVFVVLNPELGRTHVALPPVFEDTPGLLTERLMRWRGAAPEPREIDREPAKLASRVYDRATQGLVEPGTTVLRHDRSWLKKAPYAVVIVGVVAVEAVFRAGSTVWEALEPWMIAGMFVALLAIPLRWVWMTRREVTPRKGLAMVLTPAELLIRTRQGILRSRYKDIAKVSLDAKTKWSVLEGAHSARQLVLPRRHAGTIRYDEPYLGYPVEVVKALIDAYRYGWLPAADRPADEEE